MLQAVTRAPATPWSPAAECLLFLCGLFTSKSFSRCDTLTWAYSLLHERGRSRLHVRSFEVCYWGGGLSWGPGGTSHRAAPVLHRACISCCIGCSGCRVRGGSVGDRGFGSGDGGLRYAAGAAIGEDDAFQFSRLALGIDHDEVEAGAVEQRDQRLAEGQRGDADDDLFLGGAGRDGDLGAGQAVDLVENLGQADVIGRPRSTFRF